MEAGKKSRTVIRAVFTRTANTLDEQLSHAEIDASDVQATWALLEQKEDTLKTLNAQIYDLLLQQDEAEDRIIAELESVDEYELKFQKLKSRYFKFVRDSDVASRASDGDDAQSRTSEATRFGYETTSVRKFKLPVIEFKKFGGDIREWLPFWAQFLKIHEDSSIADEDKFQYLVQATLPKSRARELIESFPPTRENYDKVIDALRTRFGRDELLIEVYVRELLKLVLQNTLSKEKQGLTTLYDKLETQLRALETLGVTEEKYEAMLFPLVESSLPEEVLRVWQRSPSSVQGSAGSRLSNLMNFMKLEVEGEERIALATAGFGLAMTESQVRKKEKKSLEPNVPTLSGLINYNSKCVFCEESHTSENCFKARQLNLEQKRRKLLEKKACFRCTKIGHAQKRCRERVRCILCTKQHAVIMCPELNEHAAGKPSDNKEICTKTESKAEATEPTLANSTTTGVFLQTLRVKLRNNNEEREVRAIFDTGSQRSYILASTAQALEYPVKYKQRTVHALFGGALSEQEHSCYEARVVSLCSDYCCRFEVLDQQVICNDIPSIHPGVWTQEAEKYGIKLLDTKECGPVELLIGADFTGKLLTGRKRLLDCGLVAVHTLFGWVLMGKIPNVPSSRSTAMMVTTLLNQNAGIKELWELDVLGIKDPKEMMSKKDERRQARDIFEQSIRVDEEGRYEVRLPWVEDHPPLPSNKELAKKRLESTLKRLECSNHYEGYQEILDEWVVDGIIERVPEEELKLEGHYLPHRPVIKENSQTMKIRPVFDASAKERGTPALNDCLEKGENLIELIPEILIRFRREKIGVISDIKRAFLQIGLHKNERNFLRFLWKPQGGEIQTYRHRRVVFGVNASPFLLGATIEFHLKQCLENCEANTSPHSKEVLRKLLRAFYVDNCVSSVRSEEELVEFIKEAVSIMSQAKFDLRGWESSGDMTGGIAPVLGLGWDKEGDTLSVLYGDSVPADMSITKRVILSTTQRIFDPIGFTTPATLYPKILLQNLWKEKTGWDEPVDEKTGIAFRKWASQLPELRFIKVPRWINMGLGEYKNASLHTFCDASGVAYAAVVFLRVEVGNTVEIHLIAAKSRVAPLKRLSIPRLELMAATIGARLWHQVKNELGTDLNNYFWSDSTTVLSWIKRAEEWTVFVWNRSLEIRQLTGTEPWRHIAGSRNPADLLSRGCFPKSLTETRWWEGPHWLRRPEEEWPQGSMTISEEEVGAERRKKANQTLLITEPLKGFYNYFSKYTRIVRMIAWMYRFFDKCKRKPHSEGDLHQDEINRAERVLLKLIQHESFSKISIRQLAELNAFYDEEGLIRMHSRISERDDLRDFLYPYLLPKDHPVVRRLIFETHVTSCHVGTQGLQSILRQKFWILGGRRVIRSVVNTCQACKRHAVKRMQAPVPPLPADRVREAAVFEVVGIDLAGPLHLRGGSKIWICLFTCAVYRAVHLELVMSLSTADFLMALRRFIARRGRPKIVYTDNGTNFCGAENLFDRLNWSEIQKESSVHRICWRFSPPSAPWWGGWWERLIGMLKQLLKRTLGRACLTAEELHTVLCDCEAIINSRPLTYLSDDAKDLIPLTPFMFLSDVRECGVPDIDELDSGGLNKRYAYVQRLRNELRRRFRVEYLGLLCQGKQTQTCDRVSVGDVVLVGSDNVKRLVWPLGRVIETLSGKDGITRLVRVQTSHGQLLRPLQRLYPVECVGRDVNQRQMVPEEEDVSVPAEAPPEESVTTAKCSRSGRAINRPKRYL